ncbi:unnamed protein product [Rangifer tarandus platyrhynchus]|uniref:Uncharacterized protein n=2 Tax=Rangifer tarandus platyrhynchus TaxID=3082113 RepID=A0AC59Z1E5_RANTA|nr:unnamed protein product [Rangifer tarandus platyrhynchus]
MYLIIYIVQLLKRVTLWPHGLEPARPSCPLLSPRNLLKFMSFKSRDASVKPIVYLTHAALGVQQVPARHKDALVARAFIYSMSLCIPFLLPGAESGMKKKWLKQ